MSRFRILETFNAGDEAPSWLFDSEPRSASDTTRPKVTFKGHCCVVEAPWGIEIVHDNTDACILVSGGSGKVFATTSTTVRIPLRWQCIGPHLPMDPRQEEG